MGLIVFDVQTRGQRTTKNLRRELMWYEWAPRDKQGKLLKGKDGKDIQGKMHTMHGGQLDFKYNFAERKMNVGVAPIKITSYATSSNEKEIEEWIEVYSFDLNLSKTSGVGITVTFPDDNGEAVKKALEDTDFTYEIV
jgi:hypothetical protein